MTDNNAKLAEQARQEREHPTEATTVRVKVTGDTPVGYDGKVHDPGATFSAPQEAVTQGIARGLLERVEDKRKKTR